MVWQPARWESRSSALNESIQWRKLAQRIAEGQPPALRKGEESLVTELALTTQYSTPSAGRPRHSAHDRQHNSPELAFRYHPRS